MKSNNKNMPNKLLLLIFLIMAPLSHVEGAMNDYCAIPPFLSQSIPPSVLIVMDNSLSMCGQAYASSYDTSLFDNGLYYGYFDGSKKYKYTGNNRWEETTDSMNTGTVANPIATGSFLNWATMQRVEVAKKLLIGGKANPRSPSGSVTVKLDGETACGSLGQFSKDFNTSAGNLIYPFVGNYRFSRTNGDDLTISPISGGTNTFYTYPTSDISLPAGWSEFPVSGALIAYTKVDETPSDDDGTYIQNSSTILPVIMGFNYTQAEPAGVITVTVKVRAKKSASGGSSRNIIGLLRVDGANYQTTTSSIGTTYSIYSFEFTNNPVTAAPWTWDQIKGIAGSGNIQGFGVMAGGIYSDRYPRITQVYLDVSVTVPTGGPYNTIIDQGMVKASGIIDTLTSDVRFGLAYYASSNNGGQVDTYVGFGMPTNMITSIHNMVPSTWTPLAETLYEMTRYFSQEDPYYSNSPADYSKGAGGANIIRDPYWYKFTDLDSNLTDMYVPCAKAFVLFLTDGESSNDQSIPGSGSGACSLTNIKGCSVYGDLPDTRFAGTAVGTTYPSPGQGTDYMIDVAYWARTNDMRPGAETDVPTTWRQSLPGTQNIITYPVFMFGTGSTLLKDVSIYGGFNDLNGNNKPDCTTVPAECYRDTDGDGVIESNGQDGPATYYEGNDGYALETNIRNAINDILKRSSSGTAASVLASGEGSGANLLQALFFPKRTFDTADISWLGYLKNLWYYIDPYLNSSSIMDDFSSGTPDKILDTTDDCTIAFTTISGNVKVIKGGACASEMIDVDDMSVLWEAGKSLHSRAPSDRTIYTTTNGTSRIPFTTPANATMQSLLQASGNQDLADKIISYTYGTDYNSKFCSSTVATSCTVDADCPGGETCINYRNRTVTIDGTTDTWKLGDIISSTPKIVSWTPLNGYYKVYNDQTYKDFTIIDDYKNRGTVFVGANDGILHAFYLGKLELSGAWKDSADKKAKLLDPSSIGLGKELWGFIPKNTLPYLKYMADPDYCHIYSIDATPYIFDASINGNPNDTKDVTSWKTVLIGGMRFGGACKAAASTYGVQVPAAGMGYSSYFALDITDTLAHPDDPINYPPVPLWEFTHPDLGFSTTGPGIVRIGADTTKNGNWFIVFGSGPTGPIDTTMHQFKGFSDQQLKLFVFNVKEGPGAGNANVTTITPSTAIEYAFAGSLLGSPLDTDLNYQDDVLYFGYTEAENKPPTAATRWTKGGVLRLITKEDTNPSQWVLSKVINNIGPVTAEVAKLQNYKNDYLWLYFGTGRYYYKTMGEIDDANNQRKLYGVKEPCFSGAGFDISCTTVSEAALGPADTGAGSPDPDGWYITLDPATSTYKAERVIASPSSSTIGAVFFPTAKPSADICTYGGGTHLWAVDYDTGGKVTSALLKGKALIQVSSGSIEQIDLSEAFPDDAAHKDGRRSGMIDGLAVAAPPIITPPKAMKKTMHIRER